MNSCQFIIQSQIRQLALFLHALSEYQYYYHKQKYENFWEWVSQVFSNAFMKISAGLDGDRYGNVIGNVLFVVFSFSSKVRNTPSIVTVKENFITHNFLTQQHRHKFNYNYHVTYLTKDVNVGKYAFRLI